MVCILAACKKHAASDKVPACILNRVSALEADSIKADSVIEYSFNGRQVYVFNVSQCCDIPSVVTDIDCNAICSLGGFVPNNTCEGLKFDSAAVFIQTVWRR